MIPDEIRVKDSIFRFKAGLRDYLLNLKDQNTTPWKSSFIDIFNFSVFFVFFRTNYHFLLWEDPLKISTCAEGLPPPS